MDNEDRYAQIEAALLGVETAIDELKDADMDDAVLTLQDVKWDLDHKLKELGELLDAEEDANLAAMNREYERSVL